MVAAPFLASSSVLFTFFIYENQNGSLFPFCCQSHRFHQDGAENKVSDEINPVALGPNRATKQL